MSDFTPLFRQPAAPRLENPRILSRLLRAPGRAGRDTRVWQGRLSNGEVQKPAAEWHTTRSVGSRASSVDADASSLRAKCFSCADSNSPTWKNNLDGQVNLRDAVRRKIAFKGANGKEYKLNDKIAQLIVRWVFNSSSEASP